MTLKSLFLLSWVFLTWPDVFTRCSVRLLASRWEQWKLLSLYSPEFVQAGSTQLLSYPFEKQSMHMGKCRTIGCLSKVNRQMRKAHSRSSLKPNQQSSNIVTVWNVWFGHNVCFSHVCLLSHAQHTHLIHYKMLRFPGCKNKGSMELDS